MISCFGISCAWISGCTDFGGSGIWGVQGFWGLEMLRFRDLGFTAFEVYVGIGASGIDRLRDVDV